MTFAPLLAALSLLQAPQAAFTDDKVGEGPAAKAGDIITINYTGKFLNGQIFDSTQMTPPYAFILGARELLEGYSRLPFAALDKAIAGMKAGGKRTIVLPPELAFGDLAVGPIPAGSKLTLEVEMLDVRLKGAEAKLKIEELKEGVGEAAAMGDSVDVNYKGTFLNGRQFDSSYGRSQPDGTTKDQPYPVVLGTTRLISGFTQGITGMKAGGKRRVTIPYDLAYGTNGRPPAIPPYSVLVFELEAMRVSKKP